MQISNGECPKQQRGRISAFRLRDSFGIRLPRRSPTELDNKDFVIMKKTTYIYRQGKDTVTIVFKDDKLTEKQSTLTD